MHALVNEHQRFDKGFDAAAGPDATRLARARASSALGYEVHTESADWVLDADTAELQRQLVEGWATAASDVAPADANRIHARHARRLEHIESGRSRIRVGHQDPAAWPAGALACPGGSPSCGRGR